MYRGFKIFILFVLMTLKLSTTVYAQLKFEHLGVAEGLSQSVVLCILQDSKGFMWFCTEDGLNKYDGYQFTVYKHNPDNLNSLSANHIWSIHEDDTGILWIGTSNGLDKFDLAHETFVHYRHDSNDPNSLSHNDVRAVYEDHTGTLWIGTHGGGLNKFDRKTETFVRYQYDEKNLNSLSHNIFYWEENLYEDQKGGLWIGTYGGGLNQFDRKTETFVRYQHDANVPDSLSHNTINSIYEDRAGTLWIATNDGLNKFDRDTKTFKHYLRDTAITSIHEDRAGTLWIGTDGEGFYQFNQGSETYVHYRYDANNPYGLNNNFINMFYQDNVGGLWIGTWGGGLNKLGQDKKFKHYQHNLDPSSLSGNAVWTICEDNHGVLWIGTERNGFNKFDYTTGKFVHYQFEENNPNSLISNDVYSIVKGDKDTLWIGTWGGLDKFDSKTETFVHYQHDDNNPNSLSNNNIYTIYRDRMGFLWIGTWGYGLDKFNPQTETFVHYKHDENKPTTLSDNQINVIYQDSKGTLWFGTVAGLDKFDPKTETFEHYQYDDKNPNSLSNGEVYTIYEDSRGLLWIGTMGGGLNKFNRATNTFTHYREKKGGIPNDTINHILEDEQGNLWLSTNDGLSKFDPITKTFRNYDVNDGLQGNEFLKTSGYKTRSGELLFGGSNGFNLFNPEDIKDNPFIPPVVITHFQIFNQTVSIGGESPLQQHISLTKELTLPYSDNVFSFEFVALNYTSPPKNQYAYKMIGVDKDWVYVGSSRRFATYTHLKAGDYVFKVKGSNNDGLWNEEGTSIKITITTPWWETWWAYLLYLITVLSVIMGYVITQQRKLKREKASNTQLKQADKLKDEFLANTSHELRTPLNGIIGIAESLIDGAAGEVNDKLKSNLNMIAGSGKRLSTLVNDILDFSKLRHNTLELQLKPVALREIVDVVLTLNKPLVTQKTLQLINAIPPDFPPVHADENRLQQIFYNLIGNAIKFTESGRIEISAKILNRHYLEVTVSDTGIGIAKDKLDRIFESFEQAEGFTARTYGGTGLGLAVTKQLVELHQGQIWVESRLGVGSQFFFSLPIVEGQVETQASQLPVISYQSLETPLSLETEATAASTSTQESFKILIVDDEPVNLQVLVNHLSLQNYALTLATNGIEAIEKIEAGLPDLILLDVMMPKMTGYEVCQKLREQFPATQLPIVMLTAKNQDADLVEGLNVGANDYLTKPISKDKLLARVKTHIRLSKINLENIKLYYELKALNATLEEKVVERTAQLKQTNELIRQVFGRYLSDEIVATLLDTDSGLSLGGERREITILTSDLRGFTAQANRLPPETVIQIINLYLAAMANVITEYQGTIDEFMGDGILVLFGAPIAREDDAQRAVACAVAMQLAMSQVNEQMIAWGFAPLEMGIGINTGEVVVGNIGSEKRTKYGVIGNEVNLTYRIESYTTSEQIFISEPTLTRVGEIIKIRSEKEVKPKGIKQALKIYEVEGIGGKYNLFMKKREEERFFPLWEKVPLRYTVLAGKQVGKQQFGGHLVRLSATGALIRCEVEKDLLPAPLDNLTLNLILPNSSAAQEDIYAKVLSQEGDENSLCICFTSIPAHIKAQLVALSKIE